MSPRWVNRPEGSTWGDFGLDDELGRLNLLTPERVRRAVAEVREGLVFCLSLPLDHPTQTQSGLSRRPPALRPTVDEHGPRINSVRVGVADEQPTDVVNDDLVVLHLQQSTQWDSFAHVGQLFDADGDGVRERVYYNGFRAGEHIEDVGSAAGAGPDVPFAHGTTTGVRALGIQLLAESCLQARGVLIDLVAHVGREPVAVGWSQLESIMAADGVEVEEGDVLAIHTGLADLILEEPGCTSERLRGTCPGLDGRDPALLDWITRSGVVAIVADNFAVERMPASPAPAPGPAATLPLHEHCLFKLGVPLGELWHLGPLAGRLRADGRSRFLLTAPPLRLPGAVGSPVTPVATV